MGEVLEREGSPVGKFCGVVKCGGSGDILMNALESGDADNAVLACDACELASVRSVWQSIISHCELTR